MLMKMRTERIWKRLISKNTKLTLGMVKSLELVETVPILVGAKAK
jgi:hypothetical protein